MDVKKEIGRRIKELREARGWSIAELASHTANLSKSRIGNYEQGIRTPDPQAAKELASALGASAAYILTVDDESSLDPSEQALLKKYRLADDRGKDAIQGVADSQSAYVSRRGNKAS